MQEFSGAYLSKIEEIKETLNSRIPAVQLALNRIRDIVA